MSGFKTVDMNSMMSELQASDELLAKQVRVEDGHIIVNVEYGYEIPIVDCNTEAKLLGWILQLLEKNWMTNDVLERFIHVAARQSDIKIQH